MDLLYNHTMDLESPVDWRVLKTHTFDDGKVLTLTTLNSGYYKIILDNIGTKEVEEAFGDWYCAHQRFKKLIELVEN